MAHLSKSPSFRGREPSSKQASRTKKAVRSRDTKAELLLRKELWSRGLRYRKHAGDLAGRPDIVFRGPKVVVFVDGDFWHGRNWAVLRLQLQERANSDYWTDKIGYNRERDATVSAELQRRGWTVCRLWETDIIQDVGRCADHVQNLLSDSR